MRNIMLMVLAGLVIHAKAQDTHKFDLCEVVETYSRGEDVLFDDATYAFIDMPDDLISIDDLWISDPSVDIETAQMYTLYYSPSHNELYVFAFRSLRTWADENGEHTGTHDFCYPVKRYNLNE